MVETTFVNLAMSVGVAAKIAALSADCDRALAALSNQDGARWSSRLEDQRQLLRNPTLRAIVALTTRLAEEQPGLAAPVAPALAKLIERHPEFAPYYARVQALQPAGLPRTASKADAAKKF
ncbi:hypothetical protein [Caulobacter sp.]|uniref:hypothetical protein n=1 Tax=Caulobacter sp. TaxID=78 RepID=UPI001B061E90|nr:hypothetical protein [Caulobacter sp.]MBO9546987.1 hypothetical protein [Caulobacter sp.]